MQRHHMHGLTRKGRQMPTMMKKHDYDGDNYYDCCGVDGDGDYSDGEGAVSA